MADIVRRHDRGETFSSIGKAYGISASTVHTLYWREINSVPAEAVHEHRAKMLRQFEGQERRLTEMLERKHYVVSEGRAVYIGDPDDPEYLEDEDMLLKTERAFREVWAQKAKLLGLNAPDKVQQQVEVVQVTQQDLAIRELLQQQKALNQQSTEDVHNGQ